MERRRRRTCTIQDPILFSDSLSVTDSSRRRLYRRYLKLHGFAHSDLFLDPHTPHRHARRLRSILLVQIRCIGAGEALVEHIFNSQLHS